MEDEQKAESTVQEQAPDTSPVSETTEQSVESSEETSSSDVSTSEQEENINNSTEKTEKPRRAERRVHQLLDKLKGRESQPETPQHEDVKPQKMPWEQVLGSDEDTRLIRDGETEIDPQELIRRQETRERLLTEKLSKDVEQRILYREKLRDHTSDVERTVSRPELDDKSDQYDPVLDRLVAKQYELENRVYNPYTGKFDFVPNRSMSDIFSEVKADLEANGTRSQARVREALHVASQTGAVTPSQTATIDTSYEDEALYERARETGSSEDWAQVLKRRIK